MAARQIARDGKPKPRAARFCRCGEGLKQLFPHRGRDARPRIANLDLHAAPFAHRINRNRPALAGLQRLGGIAHEIEQDAMQLFAIGIHHQRRIDPVLERQHRRHPHRLAHIIDNRREQNGFAFRWALVGAAIAQRVGGKRHRPVERGDQPRRQPLHHRIVDRRQPFGGQLRTRQYVAQIVLDLGDRAAQGRKPRLLLQGAIDIALHRGQFAFGDSDLVAPRRCHDDTARIFRVLPEPDHRRGDPPHRPHQHEIEAKKNQHRRHDRNQQPHQQRALGIDQQRSPDRFFAHDHFHGLRVRNMGGRDDAQHPVAAFEQAVGGFHDLVPKPRPRQIDGAVQRFGHALHEKQFALLAPLQHHGIGARPHQKLAAQRGRELLIADFREGQDRDLGGFDMGVEKLVVIARDGGHRDHRLADQHIKKREQQQPPGEAVRDEPHGACHSRAPGEGAKHAEEENRQAAEKESALPGLMRPARRTHGSRTSPRLTASPPLT